MFQVIKQILILDKITRVNTNCIFSILISFIEGTSYLTLHEKVIPLVSLVFINDVTADRSSGMNCSDSAKYC